MSDTHSNVEYRDIEGYPGYRVGSDGSVWSQRPRGYAARVGRSVPWYSIKPMPLYRDGCWKVRLRRDSDPRFYSESVAVLVLNAFSGPCPVGMEARRKDGSPANNRLENLYWGKPDSSADVPLPQSDGVEYRLLDDFPGYCVGDDGSVWSLHVAGRERIGDIWRRLIPSLAGKPGKQYYKVALNRGVTRKIHQLVLLAFVGPYPPGCEVRHMDGDKLNNRLDNLEYGTPVENAADKKRHGTENVGERNGHSKLTEDQVRDILRMHDDGFRPTQIAKKFRMSLYAIIRITSRVGWKHITQPAP